MRQETEMYFEHIVREDRSVLELIDSNYTFVNEELAKVALWAEAHRDEVARVLAEATGIDLASWQRAVQRTEFRVAPLNDAAVAEQQRVADRFHKLGLIPNKIAVRDIVWKWEARS